MSIVFFLLMLLRANGAGQNHASSGPPAQHASTTRPENNLYIKESGPGSPGKTAKLAAKPKVLVVSVNGMEWDFIAPLMLRGEMPNLKSLVDRGSYGKMKTEAHATCPKIYSIFFTSTPTDENGIPGFSKDPAHPETLVDTTMLQTKPIWQTLSENNVSVGMANAPMTYPVQPVKGYMISGMLTPGRSCNGNMCDTKLKDTRPGPAVYPRALADELVQHVGNVRLDCAQIPFLTDQSPHIESIARRWLAEVADIRKEQTAMFNYLLQAHPTDFTWLTQACEDRTGHWMYPVEPFNRYYRPGLHDRFRDAFPDQYRQFDKVLGEILKHIAPDTFIFVISDHGIKPMRELEPETHDHATMAVVAHHSFHDGDDVPGVFIAAGPNIKQNNHIIGWNITAFDIAPTILSLYGISTPPGMKGRVLDEIYVQTVQH